MRRVALAALLVFGLDQITKLAVVFGLDLRARGEIDVLSPPLLNFRMAWNQGVNFGLLSSSTEIMRWLLIVLSLIITAWVWIWVQRGEHGKWMQISAGVLIGGALWQCGGSRGLWRGGRFPEHVLLRVWKPLRLQRGRYRDLCGRGGVGAVRRQGRSRV